MTTTAPRSEEPLVLLLTGTPITNGTHADLVSQLEILGRLDDVVQAPAWVRKTDRAGILKSFKRQFMAFDEDKRRYHGGKNGALLQDRLRASGGYIRRSQAQVLPEIPPLRHTSQWLSLNGALDTYRRIEADFLAWVEEQGGPEAARRAARAEVISQMNALKGEVGRAKVDAAKAWIDEYRTSRPGASLVIFAVGVKVQAALVDYLTEQGETVVHFGAGLSGDPDAMVALTESFQSGEATFAVCSVKAAGVGITLTAADTVLMVEQDWTPKDYDQAVKRIHRIGQDSHSEAVTLLGEGTIDEYLRATLERKAAIFQAALVGEDEADDNTDNAMAATLDALYASRKGA